MWSVKEMLKEPQQLHTGIDGEENKSKTKVLEATHFGGGRNCWVRDPKSKLRGTLEATAGTKDPKTSRKGS